jgi:hypothetical protein
MICAGTNGYEPSLFPSISMGVYFLQYSLIWDYNFMEKGCSNFGHEVENFGGALNEKTLTFEVVMFWAALLLDINQ